MPRKQTPAPAPVPAPPAGISPRLRTALHVALDHILDAIADDRAEAAGRRPPTTRKPRELVPRKADLPPDPERTKRVLERMHRAGII